MFWLTVLTFFILINSYYPKNAGAQSWVWSAPTKLTSGYVDKNPKFSTFDGYDRVNEYNYLAFERYYGTNSKICLLRMNKYGLVDSAMSVCDSAFKNINPSHGNDSRYRYITHVFISWQRWDSLTGKYGIFGRYYNIYSGWSGIITIDTAGNCVDPYVVCQDSTRFNVLYTRNNAIILKRINGPTGSVVLDTNMTGGDTATFRKPMMMKYAYKSAITYEKRLSGNTFALWGRSGNQNNTWSNPVQLSDNSSSENLGFALGLSNYIYVYYVNISVPFYYSRIKCATFDLQNNTVYRENIIDTSSCYNFSFSRMFDYVIIDNYQDPIQSVSVYVCDRNDGNIYARFIYGYNTIQNIRVGSVYSKYSITLSNKFPPLPVSPPYGGVCSYWGVYNKDSAAYSCLWGSVSTKVLYVEGIEKIGMETPKEFSLQQNYPNPFNVSTKIRFAVPEAGVSGRENVFIRIYDVSGKEVEVLVNDNLRTGIYEAVWNAARYSSGIYYVSLCKGAKVFGTVKMVLLK
ncbi:MAG TPA: T9SS type A sorting domain-containing protein [Ignavibacteria bacterium]|nr:T9SS type A sorting domain-containing protein [Ignavibacteria bacterium]